MQQEDSIKKLCMISSTSRNIFMGKYNSKTPVKLLGMIIRNYQKLLMPVALYHSTPIQVDILMI